MKNWLSLIMILAVFAGCTETKTSEPQLTGSATSAFVEKIEVYHFHAAQQCYSCKAVGAYAGETINTYYIEELKSGKITFASINVDEGINMEIARKYGATGSSLWIGVYDKEGFHPEQNTNVWYKINDKQAYLDYLKSIIDKRLAGDMS
jgi:hypothetical protein